MKDEWLLYYWMKGKGYVVILGLGLGRGLLSAIASLLFDRAIGWANG
jgi:hypothetical protein